LHPYTATARAALNAKSFLTAVSSCLPDRLPHPTLGSRHRTDARFPYTWDRSI